MLYKKIKENQVKNIINLKILYIRYMSGGNIRGTDTLSKLSQKAAVNRAMAEEFVPPYGSLNNFGFKTVNWSAEINSRSVICEQVCIAPEENNFQRKVLFNCKSYLPIEHREKASFFDYSKSKILPEISSFKRLQNGMLEKVNEIKFSSSFWEIVDRVNMELETLNNGLNKVLPSISINTYKLYLAMDGITYERVLECVVRLTLPFNTQWAYNKEGNFIIQEMSPGKMKDIRGPRNECEARLRSSHEIESFYSVKNPSLPSNTIGFEASVEESSFNSDFLVPAFLDTDSYNLFFASIFSISNQFPMSSILFRLFSFFWHCYKYLWYIEILVLEFLDKTSTKKSIKLPSKKIIEVSVNNLATIGMVSNSQHNLTILGKAGTNRNLGKSNTVRGIAMNLVDHPLGGEGNKVMIPVTP